MSLPELLAPMAIAFATSAILLLLSIALAFWKPKPAQRAAAFLPPAAGFLAGTLAVRGFPNFPPIDSAGWLLWAVAFFALIGLTIPRFPAIAKFAPPATVAILSVLLLKPLAGRLWNPAESVAWISATALAWLASWHLIAYARAAPRPRRSLLLLTIAAIVLPILLFLGGTASYALYALALAGTLLPFLFLPSSFCLLPSIPPALIAIPWTGLLIAGHFYASLPLSAGLLAILSLLSFALPQIPKTRCLSPGRLFAFQCLWLILFLAIAIYQTVRSGPAF